MSTDSRSQSLPPRLPAYAPGTLSGLKRKRSLSSEAGSEDAHPLKQPKTAYISPLSEANLREFEAQTSMSSTPSKKRSLSRRSTVKSDADSSRTPASSVTLATYRFRHLAAAEVRINTDPPDHFKTAIDAILQRKPTVKRRDKLEEIAKTFHLKSKKRVTASDGEDDFVLLFIQALEQVKDDKTCYHQKADWREELKPLAARQSLNMSFLIDPPMVNTTPHSPPHKHQLRPANELRSSTTDTTANPTQVADVQPPSAVPALVYREEGCLSIKTPRPDLSVGIDVTELQTRFATKFTKRALTQLLSSLQDSMKPDIPTEPLLISVPASRASDLAFPFAVVEGKSHSTGKSVFEAQNQAAVSGACALKIQLDLDNLTKQVIKASDASDSAPKAPPLLFFSVCTQGPHHELWAHYATKEDGVPSFNSSLQRTCHGTLLNSVEEFLVAFDNVCHWGTGEFLEIVVESLEMVARSIAHEG